VLSFPPLTFALYVLSPWALYFSGWYDATLSSAYVHEMMHVHLVLVGSLFFWPLLGIDPVPGRVGVPVPAAAGGPHAAVPRVPGRHDHGPEDADRRRLVPGAADGPMGRGCPTPLDDQQLAGGILWGAGDLVG
jgi:cytochrome c oxidase assembly factor CtaG